MRSLALALLACCSLTAADELWKHDFDSPEAFAALPPNPESPSVLSGVFPLAWTEDSRWRGAEAVIDYQRLTEHAFAGSGSFQIDVRAVHHGRAQANIDGLRMDGSRFHRIRLAVRSPNNSSCTIAMSMAHPPWQHHWEQRLDAGPEWSVREFLVPPTATDPQARLMLIFDRPTLLQLDDFSVTRLTRDELNLPPPPQGNLLRLGSFPLGVVSPWVLEPGEREAEDVAVDAAMPGPSGQSALRLAVVQRGDRPIQQLSSPFVGSPGEAHTFSVWLRSDTPGQLVHLRMGPPEQELWREPWQANAALTREWRQYTLTATLPYNPSGHYLARLTTHAVGTVWVDGARVEVGTTAGAGTADPPELALRPGLPTGVAFADEALPLELLAYGPGAAQASALRLSLLDQDERTRAVGSFPITAGQTLRLAIPPGDERPFGSYVVTAQLLDAAGATLGRPAETALARVRTPRGYDRLLPDSPFGIHITPTERMAAMARALGFTWVREFQLGWSGIQRSEGYDFSATDRRIDTYRRHRLQVLGVLGNVPRRYSAAPESFKGWNVGCFPPKDQEALEAWQAYARGMAVRYGATVRDWETWNEPFLPGFLIGSLDEKGKPQHGSPASFVALHRAAAAGLRSAGFPVRVLWNTGGHVDPTWERAAAELGAFEHCDAISYHHYLRSPLGFAGDAIDKQITDVRALLAGRPMAILNSEGGNAGNVSNPYPQQAPYGRRSNDREWADWWTRYYLSTLANGSERFFAYTFYGYGAWQMRYDMLNQDGSVSFCAVAISNLAWHIEGLRFAARSEPVPGLTAFAFQGADRAAVALAGKGTQRLRLASLPEGWAARDLFGNQLALPAACGGEVVLLLGPPAGLPQALAGLTP